MKAIIISHERGGSYVIDNEGCFHYIKGYFFRPVGSEIELGRKFLGYKSKFTVIAVCLLFIVLCSIFGWLWWNSESYSIYVDINPSVELVFNNLDRLIAAKPLNEDGTALLRDLNLKGTAKEIVISLIKEAEHQGYLTCQDGFRAVSITVKGGKTPEVYKADIDAALEKNLMLGFVSVAVYDTALADRTEALGRSPNK